MRKFRQVFTFSTLTLAVIAAPALAQDRRPFPNAVEGLAIIQRDADLDNGTDFETRRYYTRFSTVRPIDQGTSAGIVFSFGSLVYDFASKDFDPWGDVRDLRVSVPVSFRAGQRASVFISPQARWDYEKDASASDGFTFGALAGVSWRINEKLAIGAGFGAFTQLEDSGLDVFPSLLIDWQISDRWKLATGTGLGASEAPELVLSYNFNETLSISLAGRYERIRFRLDDDGVAPGGVGEDENFPLVLSMQYEPNPNISLSVFAGAKYNGKLTIENSSGKRIDRESYDMEDTVPIFGLLARFRF
jgi:hypothetical protein